MADVLLTHSNHIYFDAKQVRKMEPYPPLQTLLAAATLRRHGLDVAFFDSTFDNPEEGFAAALDRHRPRLVAVCEDDFNFLSKMCLLRNRELALWMGAAAQRRGIRTAAHGCDASDHVREYLAGGFDYVLIGEVEETLSELALGWPADDIRGLAYKGSAGPCCAAPRPVNANLDQIALPAWDLVDVERYRGAWTRAHGFFSLNMVSSRGCPYQCNWCAKPVYGQNYHVRSPQSVAMELLRLKNDYMPDRIWFADDIFALSPKWTLAFADAVESLGAAVPFKMQSRCDLMTRDTVQALRRAGCTEVWMGAESGSQRILDAMTKGIRVEQIHQACENLRRHGIRACLFLQFGYPGEGRAEIEETVRMVRDTAPSDIGISISYPLPGTKFHQMVSGQLGAKSNWADSGDLSMMFHGTYSSEFYKILSDALHQEVRGGREQSEAWERVWELEESFSAVGASSR